MSDIFRRYYERGFVVAPIAPKTKYPHTFNGQKWINMPNWQTLLDEPVTPDELAEWAKYPSDTGVGLLTGNVITAIDYDDHPEIWKDIETQLPVSPVRKKGEKGYTAFYRSQGEQTKKYEHKDGRTIIEVLGRGRQTVLPPSIHPCGRRYQWEEAGLLDVELANLPLLPSDYATIIQTVIDRHVSRTSRPTVQSQKNNLLHSDYQKQKIRDALRYINSDGYENWVAVGMALKTTLNGEGFELWNTWSKTSPKYKESEMQRKWNSFQRDERKAGTLFQLAKEGGYFDSIETAQLEKLDKLNELDSPIDTLVNCSNLGLVGELRDWLISSGHDVSSYMALAASLAFVGAIKGRRVRSETNARTNLFFVVTAASGAGKTECVNRLNELAKRSIGLGGFWLSDATSDSAIVDALAASPRRFLVWDEFGRKLKTLTKHHSRATYEENLVRIIMQLFSSAGKSFVDKIRAKDRTKQKATQQEIVIEDPHLSILAVTTKERFLEAIDADEIDDGFLPRFLVLDVPSILPTVRCRDAIDQQPPLKLVEKIRLLDNRYVSAAFFASDEDDGMEPTIEVETMHFESDEAFIAWATFERDCRTKKGAIWQRAAEHALKLSLVVCENTISGAILDWSIKFVCALIERLECDLAKGTPKTEWDKRVACVLRCVVECREITRSNLLRKTRLSVQDLTKVIEFLLQSSQIRAVTEQGKTKPITVYKSC